METYVHGLLQYWIYRSRVAQIAEKCIAGYILKGQSRNCDFCKSSWGLQLQTLQNIEDLFNLYYKYECNRLNAYFNVIALFEYDTLILDSKKYQRNRLQLEIQNEILLQNINFLEEDIYHDNILLNQENTKEESLEYYDENHLNQQDGVTQNKSTIKNFYTQESATVRVQGYQLFNRKKFIERWQEFFFLNATFQTICFECNNQAQNQFLANLQEEKRKHDEIYQFQKQLFKQQVEQQQQKLKSLSKLDEQIELENSQAIDEEQELDEGQKSRNYMYNNNQFNNENDIIEEENQEEDEERQQEDIYNDQYDQQENQQEEIIQEEEEGDEDNFPVRSQSPKISYQSTLRKNQFDINLQDISNQQQQEQIQQGIQIQEEVFIQSSEKQNPNLSSSSSQPQSQSKTSSQQEQESKSSSQSSYSSIKQEEQSPIISINNELDNKDFQQDFFLDKKQIKPKKTEDEDNSSSNDSSSSSDSSQQEDSLSIVGGQKQSQNLSDEKKGQIKKDLSQSNSSDSSDSSSSNNSQSLQNISKSQRFSKKSNKSHESKTHPLQLETTQNLMINSIPVGSIKKVSQAELNLQFLPNKSTHDVHMRRISKRDTQKSHINNFLESPLTFSRMSQNQKFGQQFTFVDYEKKQYSKLEIPQMDVFDDMPSISERQSQDETNMFNPLHNQFTEEIYSYNAQQQQKKPSYNRKQFE